MEELVVIARGYNFMWACRMNKKQTSAVYSNRMQAKKKKKTSNLVCAQLGSKQFQEVNFLVLIRSCVVIEQIAHL